MLSMEIDVPFMMVVVGVAVAVEAVVVCVFP
jgi:hypothetical protein